MADLVNEFSGIPIADAERQSFLTQNNLTPDMGSYIQRNSQGYLFLPHDQFTGALQTPQQFQQYITPPNYTQAQQDAATAAFRASGGLSVPKSAAFDANGNPLTLGGIGGNAAGPLSATGLPGYNSGGTPTVTNAPGVTAPPQNRINTQGPLAIPGSWPSQSGSGLSVAPPNASISGGTPIANGSYFAPSFSPQNAAISPQFGYNQNYAPAPGGSTDQPLSPTINGAPIVQSGDNAPRYTDTLRNLMNYTNQLGQYGQQQIANALQPLQNFASDTGGQYQNLQGLAMALANNIPGLLNYTGAQGQNAAGQGNALLGMLTGQGLSPEAISALTSTGGLSQNAANAVNQFSPGLQQALQQLLNPGQNATLSAAQNLFNTGLDPATQAALQTQALDTTAQQYNNAKQGVLGQLLQSGAIGQGLPGAAGQQSDLLGGLSAAQQQQQSNLQQQGILANQQALDQNRQLALQAVNQMLGTQLGAFGQGAGFAQGLGSLQQQAAENMAALQQQALASNTGLGIQGAGTLGNQALGYNNQLQSLLGMGMQSPLPYLSSYQNALNQLLGGSQALGQMGLQGISAMSPLLAAYTALSTAPSTLNQIWSTIAGAGAGVGADALSKMLKVGG